MLADPVRQLDVYAACKHPTYILTCSPSYSVRSQCVRRGLVCEYPRSREGSHRQDRSLASTSAPATAATASLCSKMTLMELHREMDVSQTVPNTSSDV